MLSRFTITKWVTSLYFALGLLLLSSVITASQNVVIVVKPLVIPTLATLYIITSKKRDWIFILALVSMLVSNILLLIASKFFDYAVGAFLVHRLFIIYIVLKYTSKVHLTAFLIAIVPFLFLFCYLFDLTNSLMAVGFYTALLSTLVISVLAALALSNYIFEDNRRNSWLLISSLLFVIAVLLFVIEKFYITHPIFQPISTTVFVVGHYGVYRYILLSEESYSEPQQNSVTERNLE